MSNGHTGNDSMIFSATNRILLIVVFAMFFLSTSAYCWWDNDWGQRENINVRSVYSTTTTAVSCNVIVDTESLIDAGDMQADGDDIRFTLDTGASEAEIPFFIKSGLDTTTTEITVQVTTIPAAPQLATLYMYYDNSSATNGETLNVEIDDDFDDQTTGNDPTGWSVYEGGSTAIAITASQYYGASGKSVDLDDNDSGAGYCMLYQAVDSLETYYFSGYFRFAETNVRHIPFMTQGSTSQYIVVAYSDGTWRYFNGSAYVAFANEDGYSANTWYHVEVVGDYSADEFSVWIDGDLVESGITIPGADTSMDYIKMYAATGSATGQMWADDILLAREEPGGDTTSFDAGASRWHYTDYDYRLPLYVDSPFSADLEEAIITFKVDTESLVDASKMQGDCDDIRFTYFDPYTQQETPVDYYMTGEDSAYTGCWLKLDNLYAGTKSTDGDVNWGTQAFQQGMANFNGKTYVAYLADEYNVAYGGTDKMRHKIMITVYDLNTNSWSTPVKIASLIGNDVEEANEHRYPSICVDNSGYIHVFYGCHGDSLLYKKSTNPESISSWTAMTSPDAYATYPRAFCDENNKLWVFFRSLGASTSSDYDYRTSTNGGTTWSSPTNLIDGDTTGTAYVPYVGGMAFYPEGPEIHLIWTWAYLDHYNLTYARTLDGGSTWEEADGTNYSLPITKTQADNSQLIYSGGDRKGADITLDADGDPKVTLFKISSPTSLYFARFGTSWSVSLIDDGNVDCGKIDINPVDGQYEIFSRYATGLYKARRFISTDEGSNWTSMNLNTNSVHTQSVPINCKDGGPIKAAWITGYTNMPRGLTVYPSLYNVHPAGTVFMYYGNSNATNGESSRWWLNDKFDGETAGNDPANFAVADNPPGSDVAIDGIVYYGASGKSLKLYDGSASDYARLVKTFTEDSQVGGVVFYVRFGENNVRHTVVYGSDDASNLLYLVFARSNGKWGYIDGSEQDFPEATSYSANTWYKLECYWNFGEDKFWVYVDGVTQAIDGLTIPGDGNALRNWQALPASTAAQGTMWIDTIDVDYNMTWPKVQALEELHEVNPW